MTVIILSHDAHAEFERVRGFLFQRVPQVHGVLLRGDLSAGERGNITDHWMDLQRVNSQPADASAPLHPRDPS